MAKLKSPKIPDVLRTFYINSEHRNSILMVQNDKRTILYLKLAAERNRKRRIGVITKSTKTLKVTRIHAKHYFRKLSGYGFNDYVLRTAISFDKIWLKDDYSEWKIPVDYILAKGTICDSKGQEIDKEQHILHFKEKGFERQIFVPLVDIEQFRVLKKENRRF
jgi:hypothetical protein